MEKEKLARYKRALINLAIDLKKSLEAGQDMSAVVSLDDPVGRLSRAEALQSQEMSLGLKAGMRRRYDMIGSALYSIEEGTYGTCVGCKKPIGEARLDALPETPLCVDCSA